MTDTANVVSGAPEPAQVNSETVNQNELSNHEPDDLNTLRSTCQKVSEIVTNFNAQWCSMPAEAQKYIEDLNNVLLTVCIPKEQSTASPAVGPKQSPSGACKRTHKKLSRGPAMKVGTSSSDGETESGSHSDNQNTSSDAGSVKF